MKETLLCLSRTIPGLFLSLSLCIGLISAPYALEADKDQPATLDADEFDMDFQTGVRTYRGNVIYQQGSIRLYSDELVAYFKDGQLLRAVARGNRAEFHQRPDNSESDVVGVALRIELDEVGQLVTLEGRAKVTQDENTVTGKQIVYNMSTEKVKVRSGQSKKKTAGSSTQPVASESEIPPASEDTTSRPRIVIKPRK
jgi:lipopolysaccharide export system protein LptA